MRALPGLLARSDGMTGESSQLHRSRSESVEYEPNPDLIVSGLIEVESIFAKVERAKREWEATADSLLELVCVVDAQGCVVRANRTIEAWQIGDVKAIQGFSLHTLLHPGCLGLYCLLDRYLRQQLGR